MVALQEEQIIADQQQHELLEQYHVACQQNMLKWYQAARS